MSTSDPYRLRLVDRLYRRLAWRFYPRSDGDVVLIGPECFADLDATVICWQGENYYRPGHAPRPGDQHGTTAARRRHARRGEEPCDDCQGVPL